MPRLKAFVVSSFLLRFSGQAFVQAAYLSRYRFMIGLSMPLQKSCVSLLYLSWIALSVSAEPSRNEDSPLKLVADLYGALESADEAKFYAYLVTFEGLTYPKLDLPSIAKRMKEKREVITALEQKIIGTCAVVIIRESRPNSKKHDDIRLIKQDEKWKIWLDLSGTNIVNKFITDEQRTSLKVLKNWYRDRERVLMNRKSSTPTIVMRNGHMEKDLLAMNKAASDGNLAEVRRLLERDPKLINSSISSNRTPIYWATLKGHKVLAEFLIAKGADVNIPDSQGMTPLKAAQRYLRTLSRSGRGAPEMLQAMSDTIDVVQKSGGQ